VVMMTVFIKADFDMGRILSPQDFWVVRARLASD